jgi:uncharacterized repeat protein (TIGR04076 family)
MYELKISVKKVMGKCTAHPPLKKGDFFTIRDGDIRIPKGGFVCLWALQNLLMLITPKEREIAEKKEDDWMWRVSHAQCPDPNGRVIFKIEQMKKLENEPESKSQPLSVEEIDNMDLGPVNNKLNDLTIEVEAVKGKCTSGMRPGDCFKVRSGRLYIPAGRHFCLYAIQAVLPFLAANQRNLEDGDWMKEENRIICPDPEGNVIMRIKKEEK